MPRGFYQRDTPKRPHSGLHNHSAPTTEAEAERDLQLAIEQSKRLQQEATDLAVAIARSQKEQKQTTHNTGQPENRALDFKVQELKHQLEVQALQLEVQGLQFELQTMRQQNVIQTLEHQLQGRSMERPNARGFMHQTASHQYPPETGGRWLTAGLYEDH